MSRVDVYERGLEFISEYIRGHKHPPTVREFGDRLDLAPGDAREQLRALEQGVNEGSIRWIDGRWQVIGEYGDTPGMDQQQAIELQARLAANGTANTDVANASRVLTSYTAGIGQWIDRLSRWYLRGTTARMGLCQSDAHCKLVLAPNGGGKTHFLQSLGARALHDGFAVSYVSCHGRADLDPLDLHREFIQNLQLPGNDQRGLLPLIDAIGNHKRSEIVRADVRDVDAAYHQWIRTLHGEYPTRQFGRILSIALHAAEQGGDNDTSVAAQLWLQGEIDGLSNALRNALMVPHVPARQRPQLGRALTSSMAKFLPNAGVAGSVLLIDEAEMLFGGGFAARLAVLTAMRVMVDVQSVPLLTVFAATPEIVNYFSDYPAVDGRLAPGIPRFENGNDLSPQLLLDKVLDQGCLQQIGRKLIQLVETATQHQFNFQLQMGNLDRLLLAIVEDINVRIFVKTWVNLLRSQAVDNHERDYDQDDLRTRYRGYADADDDGGLEP